MPDDLSSAGAFNKKVLVIIICVSLAFMFTYYGVVASGAGLSGFRTAEGIAQTTGEQVSTLGFLDPRTKEPLAQTAIGLDFPLASLGGKLWRILQYIVEICIIVGFFRLIFRPATLGKLKAEYISLTIVSAVILLSIFVLPAWSSGMDKVYAYGMGITRIWQIALLLMSPLFIFGGEAIALGIVKSARALHKRSATLKLSPHNQILMQIPIIFILISYFIFNAGIVFELSRSQTTNIINMPYSIALSSYRLDLSTVLTQQDLAAAGWLCKVPKEEASVYVDDHSGKLYINQIDFPCKTAGITSDISNIGSTGYVYLGGWNVHQNMLTFATGYATRQSISFDDLPWFRQVIETADRIYNNGGAQVFVLE